MLLSRFYFKLLLGSLALMLCFSLLAQRVAAADMGYVIYRVYLPANDINDVQLPSLVYHYADGSQEAKKPCSSLINFDCAWLTMVNPIENPGINVALPDLAAYYWLGAYRIEEGMRIELRGTYPDARYMSINLYDATFSSYTVNTMPSALADFLIEPDVAGSNPWQYDTSPGASFTVHVTADAMPGKKNTMPMPPVYEETSLPRLPELCQGDCLQDAFYRPSSVANLFANLDNAYVAAFHQPEDNELLVVRGKVPPTPTDIDTNHPSVWPTAAGVRYWSLCNIVHIKPYPAVYNRSLFNEPESGCLADSDLNLDSDGYYTVVISDKKDKPQRLSSDENWLPNSNLMPNREHVLLMRNMLAYDFPEAINWVPSDDDPASAKRVMGEYYPEVYRCDAKRYRWLGLKACR